MRPPQTSNLHGKMNDRTATGTAEHKLAKR
jgi:hypothetical protein